MFDVAVVGAGISGLVAARSLQEAGYGVVVLEKSRGFGGRCATRRLARMRADHGLRGLTPQGKYSQGLIETLLAQGIVQPWLTEESLFYIAPEGMNAVGKFLAQGLDVHTQQRVSALQFSQEQGWNLEVEGGDAIASSALVMAIPAPQALELLKPLSAILPEDFLPRLQAVTFDPCIAVMAGYPEDKQGEVNFIVQTYENSDVAWMGLDSSKRRQAPQPVFVFHSRASFAQQHLEDEDLQPAGQYLLNCAAKLTLPWLATPEFMQVHRWRYAFPQQPLSETYLSAKPLKLVCCGDWCGGYGVESALQSGLSAATELHSGILPV
ncbi:FAD-dependent oxidoreductase [Oscillatoria amoena NRMC-F 0135]|nr:FAD-dependent oxidoreductase [Geitlerinema splendidum]MDL5044813.1 FAD-dependent oxidoreductase [Oscillatoria amoena NRMC-F 0135]